MDAIPTPRDRALNRIELTSARRDVSAEQVRQHALELGALIDRGRVKHGITISEVSRHLGIPRATLNALVKDAQQTGYAAGDAEHEIARLEGAEFIDFVRTNGPIVEIIASFAESDVVYLSELPFHRFVVDNRLRAPGVLVFCAGVDDWIALDNATVGYGGTGPSNTVRALKGAGIADDIAEAIAFENRVSHVQFDANGRPTWKADGRKWPRVHLPMPTAMDNGRRFKFKFARSLTDSAPSMRLDARRNTIEQLPDPTLGGFYSAQPEDGLGLAARLFNFLDNPPQWLDAPRTATLFATQQAARVAGFADDYVPQRKGTPTGLKVVRGFSDRHVYQLIIEQGPIQIWESDFTPDDPTQWVPHEFHAMLQLAGLFPHDIVERDESSALRKLITGHRRGRPSEISIPEGNGVTWRPAMQYGYEAED